jgi:predicted pyridoxine 5'-phosphate oxidase superfamily flavin-nucleotide-binding protein
MSKPQNFGDLAFTPAVKSVQERLGTRRSYSRLEGRAMRTEIGPDEAEFIAERDSFYMATVGENGWPYMQYRGGPKGFLRVLGATTLGFADFRGNGQYVSTGNVLSTHHACLFLMDYPNQTRMKIWTEAEISDDRATIARVTDASYPAQIERAFLFHVQAFDWNCHKYIVQRFTREEFAAMSVS